MKWAHIGARSTMIGVQAICDICIPRIETKSCDNKRSIGCYVKARKRLNIGPNLPDNVMK